MSKLKWGSLAYYWPDNRMITAEEAINKRENDLRTGDIWCHKQCYENLPRTGNELFARDGNTPHFWIGSGNFVKKSSCNYQRKREERSESDRYLEFLTKMIAWMSSEEVPQEWGLSRIEISNKKHIDAELTHIECGIVPRTKTRVVIRDKNRKRNPLGHDALLIDIKRWTKSQVADFEEYGTRKVKSEWERLNKTQPQFSTMRDDLVDEPTSLAQKIWGILKSLDSLKDTLRRYKYQNEISPLADSRYGKLMSSQQIKNEFVSGEMKKINNNELLETMFLEAGNCTLDLPGHQGLLYQTTYWPDDWWDKISLLWPYENMPNDLQHLRNLEIPDEEMESIVDEAFRLIVDGQFGLVDALHSYAESESLELMKGESMVYIVRNYRTHEVLRWHPNVDPLFKKLLRHLRTSTQ